jgi:hypothetical protein
LFEKLILEKAPRVVFVVAAPIDAGTEVSALNDPSSVSSRFHHSVAFVPIPSSKTVTLDN